jgi:hypothetical protein
VPDESLFPIFLNGPGSLPSSKPSWKNSAATMSCCSGNQWEGTRPGWLVLWILSVYSSSGWLCPPGRLDACHQGGLLVPAAGGGSAYTEGGWRSQCCSALSNHALGHRLAALTQDTHRLSPDCFASGVGSQSDVSCLYPTLLFMGRGWLPAVLLTAEYLDFYQNGIFSCICVSINPS